MKHFKLIAFCLAAASAAAAGAQTKLDVSLSGGSFARDESNSYLSYSVRYTASPTLDLAFRGTDGKRQTFEGGSFEIVHGGDERELIATLHPLRFPKLDAGVGISVAGTPERQNEVVATYDIGWTETDANKDTLRVGLKGFAADSPITAFTARGIVPLERGPYDLVAELGVPFVGDNTRSTSDGSASREILGSFGIQFGQRDRAVGTHVSLMFTNQLGSTTGMSLTPALGNRYAFVLSVGTRF